MERKIALETHALGDWKLEVTQHRLPCRISLVSLFGESRLAWLCPPTWPNPRRDDKSATRFERGSIGKISENVVCGSY